jgi:hypothetical protein
MRRALDARTDRSALHGVRDAGNPGNDNLLTGGSRCSPRCSSRIGDRRSCSLVPGDNLCLAAARSPRASKECSRTSYKRRCGWVSPAREPIRRR